MKSNLFSEIMTRGGIRFYRKSSLTDKRDLYEEFTTTVPLFLRRKNGLWIDEMAWELANDYIITDASENCLLRAIEQEMRNYKNGIYDEIPDSMEENEMKEIVLKQEQLPDNIKDLQQFIL